MRKGLQISFIILIILSLVLSFIAYNERRWETLTACLSLTIAIISAWVAAESFYSSRLADRPQLILSFDFKSRYGLILLSLQNLGNKPAYKIKVNWDNALKDSENNPITFSYFENSDFDVQVLNKNELITTLIDGSMQFFTKYKSDSLTYHGTLTYYENLYTKKQTKLDFCISLDNYKKSLSFETEEPRTHHELQQIPKILTQIQKDLSNLVKLLGRD